MAAFYKYICRFENCLQKFNTLVDLIDHIEYMHIIRDPLILKQQELSQPPAIALSYVNCFYSENLKKERPEKTQISKVENDKKLEKNDSLNDSFDSLLDDDTFSDAGSDDSCLSWATSTSSGTQQGDSSSINLSQSLQSSHGSSNHLTVDSLQGKFTCLEDSEGKKRFLCTVPGCTKRYKNINGIKYHVKNGHNKKDTLTGEVKKNFLCHCGKAYKSQSGLRHHQNTQHTQKSNNNVNNQNPSYTPVQYDARLDSNFKQPQALKQSQTLPPVAEMYQPHTPRSPPAATIL